MRGAGAALLVAQALVHLGSAARPGGEPFGATGEAHASAPLPPAPAGWPATLQIGISDGPGNAAATRQLAPFGFRYQYRAGGANTGAGWATWNADAQFASYYVQDSVAQGITPVFTYYMIRQSAPGKDMDEAPGVRTNLENAATMRAYFEDLKLFFQRAGAFPTTRVILHVEPDMWGHAQQWATNDAASSVAAKVASTGLADLAGLPDTMAGIAQAAVRLRDAHAPNVQLGYHLSVWGTGVDILYADPSNAEIDALAGRAAAFYRSLGADFDLVFAEFSDRDAEFKRIIYGDGGASWWHAGDFDRNVRFIAEVVARTGKRVVFWQIPYGNTKMRAMDNSWGHYQDNKVEWLLDDPSRANVRRYLDVGVVAFLFGGGADGVTCPCDAEGDGVTNPNPVNGNSLPSLSADDDGGFFDLKAAAYYAAGAMPLSSSGGGATPTGTATTPPSATATATTVPPTPTPAPVCTSRPQFSVRVVPAGVGELRVTVAAGTPVGASGNRVRAIRVGSSANARVELTGHGLMSDGQRIQLAAGLPSMTLTVRRAAPGVATTVPLTLTDDCGDWQTLVGGGPTAF